MRNPRPTQSPSRASDEATEAEETRSSEDEDTRIQFLSWDAPLVPDRQ